MCLGCFVIQVNTEFEMLNGFLFFIPVQPISGNLKRIYLPVNWIPQMETFLRSLHMQRQSQLQKYFT